MATDWRDRVRPRAVQLLEARDMNGWEAFLVGLLLYARSEEIEAFANEVLASTSHETQMYWNGRCECTDHLLN